MNNMNSFNSFDSGYSDTNVVPSRGRINPVPVIVAAVLGTLLIAGVVLMFVFFNPFVNKNDEVLKDLDKQTAAEKSVDLCVERRRWVIDGSTKEADAEFFLNVNGVDVSSAKLYTDDGQEAAVFKKSGDKFTATVRIGVDEVKEYMYIAKYDTKDSTDLETNYLNLSVFDDVDHAKLTSESMTALYFDKLMDSDEITKLPVDEQAELLTEKLEELYVNDPEKGEPFVVRGSINFDKSPHKLTFNGAAGILFIRYLYTEAS